MSNKLNWLYKIGLFIILTLPILTIPPYFFPADWGKSIVFRSVMAIMLFLFIASSLRARVSRSRERSVAGSNLNRGDCFVGCDLLAMTKNNPIRKPLASNGASKIIWALGGLFGIFLLASIFSVDPLFSFWGSPYRGGGFVTFAFYFVFAIMAFLFFRKQDPHVSEAGWQKAWVFSIFIGILVSFVGIIQYYGLFNKIFAASGQPPSTLGNPIILAIYLLLLFFPTLSFAINQSFDTVQGKLKKIFYIFSLLIFLFTILISGTRAAYLGIFIGVLYFLLFFPVRDHARDSATEGSLGQAISNGARPVKSSQSEVSRETGQFNRTSPKKLKILKICIGLFIIFILAFVLYANVHPGLPKILQNRITTGLVNQLSIKHALNDERYRAWQTAFKEVLDKPILGWGPENFAVGFDKNYDPKITTSPWWDKAHNIFLDTGAEAGILGILAYLALFGVLFWQLHKVKHAENNPPSPEATDGQSAEKTLMAHGIQATLIGYLVANFFSFDSFGTYIIFFLIIAYSLHLTSSTNDLARHCEEPTGDKAIWTSRLLRQLRLPRNDKFKNIALILLFILLIIFLYQYNWVPFEINAQINKANSLANQKMCDQAFSIMDKILPEHSILDSYAIIEYGNFEKTCSVFYPENNLAYTKKIGGLLLNAVKIQPLYTRYWLYLGTLTTTLAEQETDSKSENAILSEADGYLDKALQLAPKHQEIFIAKAKIQIDEANYKNAENISEKCIALNSNIGDCYWYLGLAEIYLDDYTDANKNMQLAGEKGVNVNSETSLDDLANAYGSFPDYKNLEPVFEKLIAINPNNPQYHSTLALIYAKLGEYDKARQEAATVLQLSPQSKPNVDEFLKTLPLK